VFSQLRIASHAAELDFGQVIQGGPWVHYGVPASGESGRQQVLIAIFFGPGTSYSDGL
jgi:hypothetical protein